MASVRPRTSDWIYLWAALLAFFIAAAGGGATASAERSYRVAPGATAPFGIALLPIPAPTIVDGVVGTLGTMPGPRGPIFIARPCEGDPYDPGGCQRPPTEDEGIFAMQERGALRRQILPATGVSEISLSRDQQTILFQIGVDPDADIYTVGIDGQGLTRLTGPETSDYEPRYLTDGRIVFQSRGPYSLPQAFVMNADGADPHPLDQAIGAGRSDGKQVAVSRCVSHGCSIYLYRRDGHLIRRLTQAARFDSELAFAPNGRMVAFVRRFGHLHASSMAGSIICLVRSDGSSRARCLTRQRLRHWLREPMFSPDGRELIFERWRHGHGDWLVRNLRNGQTRHLVDGEEALRGVAWQALR